jgi:hypothetical protein
MWMKLEGNTEVDQAREGKMWLKTLRVSEGRPTTENGEIVGSYDRAPYVVGRWAIGNAISHIYADKKCRTRDFGSVCSSNSLPTWPY